ncbi:alanine--tRNA ligase [Candidatus Parcubacteria bacterium]|nr:alanine--tRNA ligase [Candidatus Parcubacteria bacterium]
MTSFELRQKFLDFFKKRGHKIVGSSSLVPDDESVLLTTAGMQQFTPELSGKIKSHYSRVCSVQKCFRTPDIEEVGDDTHHTFFEMLGNWSFGDYFKEEAVKWALEFLLNECKLDKEKLYITVFKGKNEIPKDKESIKIWQDNGIPNKRIFEFGMEDNFWGPAGEIGPCGPCSEIHYDKGRKFSKGKCSIKGCGPNCDCGRFVEIWNLVFMEYHKKIQNPKYKYILLPQKNVDTGIGFERLVAILQQKSSSYETDLFLPLIESIEKSSSTNHKLQTTNYRIIADHIRGSVFLIADGVLPSNVDRGYILRRILRRAIRHAKLLNLSKNWYADLIKEIISIYGIVYPEIKTKETDIITVIQDESEKFSKALAKGLKEFKTQAIKFKIIPGNIVFNLYQSYGFPLEMTKELAEEKGLKVDEKGFEKELKKHQEISRAGVKKKFGGGGEISPQLHTATHLLHQALRDVLGSNVKQMGSDINSERLRFDFSHSEKMTSEQMKKVEEIVNQKIKQNLIIIEKEMPLDEAIKSGALSFFKEKYPEIVKVYSIQDFSKEICAGPHVKKTGELGVFKIIKEQSSGAGIRRIKAVLSKKTSKTKF